MKTNKHNRILIFGVMVLEVGASKEVPLSF